MTPLYTEKYRGSSIALWRATPAGVSVTRFSGESSALKFAHLAIDVMLGEVA